MAVVEIINYMLFALEIILFIFGVCIGVYGTLYILQEIKKMIKNGGGND